MLATLVLAVILAALGGPLLDGDREPPRFVVPPRLASAQAADPLLHRRLDVTADDATAVASITYRWTRGEAPSGADAGTPLGPGDLVSFAATSPDEPWTLWVRAADLMGNRTWWTVAWSGVTPSRPVVLLLGDSVASGQHADGFLDPPVCNDPSYSFGAGLVDLLDDRLPAQWAPRYLDLARGGFSTASILDGGVDGCGDVWPPPIGDAERTLRAARSSWNRVVVTAGVNDTGWSRTLGVVTIATLLAPSDTLDHRLCSEAAEHWRFDEDALAGRVRRIADRLRSADPAARMVWLGYHRFAGTGPLPATCAGPLDDARDRLHAAIAAGLAPRDVPLVIPEGEISVQRTIFGWPHPDERGQAALAGFLADRLR